MRRVLTTAVIAAALLVSFIPAASASGLPDTRLRIQSVVLEPSSGTVTVTARTKCSGEGTMSWETSLRQGVRHDRARQNVPCDGVARTQTLILESRTGRFHAGRAIFMLGDIICGTDICIGGASAGPIRLLPNRSAINQ